MSKAFWTITFLGFFLALGALMAHQQSSGMDYTCTFQRINGAFRIGQRELQGESKLITVRRGDRVFMLRRSLIVGCVDHWTAQENPLCQC